MFARVRSRISHADEKSPAVGTGVLDGPETKETNCARVHREVLPKREVPQAPSVTASPCHLPLGGRHLLVLSHREREEQAPPLPHIAKHGGSNSSGQAAYLHAGASGRERARPREQPKAPRPLTPFFKCPPSFRRSAESPLHNPLTHSRLKARMPCGSNSYSRAAYLHAGALGRERAPLVSNR